MSNEHVFTMNVEGTSGERHKGVFKFKIRLSHRDTLKMDAFRRELLGQNPENAGVDAFATAKVFAKVWTHLLEAPSWWKESGNGLDLDDEEPVMDLLAAIQAKEKEGKVELTKKADEAKVELQAEVKG